MLETTLTIELVTKIFERLCISEVKRRVYENHETGDFNLVSLQDGFQSGYVYCLVDFFGEVDDETNARAFFNGESYIHVLDNIISTHLSGLIDDLSQNVPGDGLDISVMEQIEDRVKSAVKQYMKSNAKTAIRALKVL